MSFNPNSNRDGLDKIDLNNEHCFPLFLKGLNISLFRGVKNLKLQFKHPISFITGTNKIGKTTLLGIIGCSHVDFRMRDRVSGEFYRGTWSDIMKFTKHDKQDGEWEYDLIYKRGQQNLSLKGKRTFSQSRCRWSGVSKKGSLMIDDRVCIFIDVDRIFPARRHSNVLFNLSQSGELLDVNSVLQKYLGYIFEQESDIKFIAKHSNKNIYKFNQTYSSFNSASGEDVVMQILLDLLEVPEKSLILIDEIDLGLHPKIQRRLLDVIQEVAIKGEKQFIITTHSPSVFSSLSDKSRIFIETDQSGDYRAISGISMHAALSKMDSEMYPLVNLFCEDDVSKKIIERIINYCQEENKLKDLHKLVNIIVSGTVDKTYSRFKIYQETYHDCKIKIGSICVIDGDQRKNIEHEDDLFFLYSDHSPEYFLLEEYLKQNQNETLNYHLKNSSPHCLFDKCIECGIGADRDQIFHVLWDNFIKTDDGSKYIKNASDWLLKTLRSFSVTT